MKPGTQAFKTANFHVSGFLSYLRELRGAGGRGGINGVITILASRCPRREVTAKSHATAFAQSP